MSVLKKKGFLPCLLLGAGGALAVTLLLLLAISAAINGGALPLTAVPLSACICTGAAVLCASFTVCKLRGRDGLAMGVSLAAVYLAVCLIACLVFGGEPAVSEDWFSVPTAALGGGLLGAVLSVRQNTHHRRRR